MKELNFILANRAPELSAHYSFPLEPHKFLLRKYQTLSAHTSADLPPILQIKATEGGHKPEATTSTDIQGSHHQSPEVTMKIELDIHTGQVHILTIITTQIDSDIRRDHLINSGVVTETGITHITLQNPQSSKAKITITTVTVMLTILNLICLYLIPQN